MEFKGGYVRSSDARRNGYIGLSRIFSSVEEIKEDGTESNNNELSPDTKRKSPKSKF